MAYCAGCFHGRRRERLVEWPPRNASAEDIKCIDMRCALFAIATLCLAQQNSEPNAPHFEVASVKPATSRELGGVYGYPGGRMAFRGCTLSYLLQLAFDLQEYQFAGQEDWMKSDRFDIDAKVPAGLKSSSANPPMAKMAINAEQRRMLQSLLVDRFGLKYRQDATEGSVYLLTRNGKTLKMTDAKDKNDFPWSGSVAGGALSGDGMRGMNESMADLSHRLSGYVGRPVVDRTELPGSFDFRDEVFAGGWATSGYHEHDRDLSQRSWP